MDMSTETVYNSKDFIKARVDFLSRFPFFGNLLLNMKLTESSSETDTIKVNGEEMVYNPEFMASLSHEETVFIFLHETMHVACLHHIRQPKPYIHEIWQIATDYVVNDYIINLNDKTLKMPEYGIYDQQYHGLSAEKVYSLLLEKQNNLMQEEKQSEGPEDSDSSEALDSEDSEAQENSDSDSDLSDILEDIEGSIHSDSSDIENQSSLPQELEELFQKTQQCGEIHKNEDKDERTSEQEAKSLLNLTRRIINKSNEYNSERAENIPYQILKEIDIESKLNLNWQSILADFFQYNSNSDYDWLEPDEILRQSNILMPSLSDKKINNFAIAIDTSGSIDKELLDIFIGEAKKILLDIYYQEIYVIYCTNQIVHYDIFSNEDEIKIYEARTGGTAFDPVWQLIDEKGWLIDGLVYFTDLQCYRFGDEPEYPVLWCVFENMNKDSVFYGKKPDLNTPFGKVCKLN